MIGNGRKVELTKGRATLGRWGELIVSGANSARIETISGETLEVDESTAAQISDMVRWLEDENGLLLFIPVFGATVEAFDLRYDRTWRVDWLVRDDDEELRHLGIRPTSAGELLVLYERGLLCIGAGGRVRWHILHDDISARFETVEDDHVTIGTQWPVELMGRERRYSLATGELQSESLPGLGNST